MGNPKSNCTLLRIRSSIYLTAVSSIGTAPNWTLRVSPLPPRHIVSHQLGLCLARNIPRGFISVLRKGGRDSIIPRCRSPRPRAAVSSRRSPLRLLALRPSWETVTCRGERQRDGTASFPLIPKGYCLSLDALKGSRVLFDSESRQALTSEHRTEERLRAGTSFEVALQPRPLPSPPPRALTFL